MSLYTYDGNVAVNTDSIYNGKKISLLGDSITTYVGYIPSGQSSEYNGTNYNGLKVTDTWWMKLINALEMTLLVNNSWSGTCVSTARDSVKGVNSNAMVRSELLGDDPDVIIFYMGINDFCFEVDLGSYDGSTELPQEGTDFSSSYAIALNKMMAKYKTAEIWCATLPQCERNGSTGAPEINDNDVALADFNKRIQQLAKTFGAKILDFAQCGLTYQNMSIYMGDWVSSTEKGLHPNIKGMSVLANQAIRQLDPYCRTRYQIEEIV